MKIAICADRKNGRTALRALLEAYGQDFENRKYHRELVYIGDKCYRTDFWSASEKV